MRSSACFPDTCQTFHQCPMSRSDWPDKIMNNSVNLANFEKSQKKCLRISSGIYDFFFCNGGFRSPYIIQDKNINRNNKFTSNINTKSVRKVSGLPLYLRAKVFERPLRGMNVNSKASRTYRLLADICQTYSSCAACLCLQSYFESGGFCDC